MATHEISVNPEQAGELAAPIIAAVLRTSPARKQYWIGKKKQLEAELLKVLEGKAIVQTPLLALVASGVSITEAPAVKIADCFKVGDGVYAYRDPDFDRWLPKEIPAAGAGVASMFELADELTFQGMVRMHIGGFPDELEKALIKQGKCYSPKQIDDLIRQCEAGENPLELRTDGWANLFFIQVGDSVFAVYAYRHSGGWRVFVREFADANRWSAEYRVSFRN